VRVLLVNISLDAVAGGGTAVKTRALAAALGDAGVDVTVLTTDVGLRDGAPVVAGASVVALRCLVPRFYVPLVSPGRFRRLVRSADVVLLLNHWTALNAAAYWTARAAGKPYVVLPAGALPLFGRSKTLKRVFNTIVGRALVRRASAQIATTRDEVGHFAAYGVPAERVTVIPNAIDTRRDWRAPAAAFRERIGAPFVLFLGRLNAIKGPDLLLEAFARVSSRRPDLHLVLAGPDGGLGAALQGRATALGIATRVHLTGALDEDGKIEAYRSSELLAVPSRQEAMSLVVLEAGLAARPVLITDACGVPDVGEVDGGAVVAPTVDGIADGLWRMLSASPEESRARGERWRQRVVERFGWDAVAPRYIHLFEQVLAGRRNATARA
jgi:glycosyltransferase involved in cell wall biosynthesis